MANPSVNVDINAIDKTKRAADSAKTRLGGIGSKAKTTFGNISTLALGPVGAIAGLGGAALALVTNFASTADEFSKLSQRTGESTENLSKLRHAFDQNDLSSAQFEKTMRRLTERIGQGEGASEKIDAQFAALGITWEELESLSPTEQFALITDEISKLDDKQAQAAASSDIFGKKLGPDLLTVIEGGRQGLADYAEEAEALGKVVDQDTADSAAAFNDALDEVSDVLGSLGNELGAVLLPVLVELVNNLLPVFQTLIKAISPLLRIAGAVVSRLAGFVGALIGKFLEFVEGLGIIDFLNSLAESFGTGEGFITGFGDTVKNVLSTVAAIFRGVFKFIGDIIKFGVALYIAYIKDLAFGIVSLIQGGLNGAISVVEKFVNFVKNLFFDMADIVLGIIKSLISGIIQPLIDGLRAIPFGAGNPLADSLEGFLGSIAVNRPDDISIGRVDLVGGLGLQGGNIQSVIGGGFPVLNINVEGSILSEGDLANVVNKVSTVGLVGAG